MRERSEAKKRSQKGRLDFPKASKSEAKPGQIWLGKARRHTHTHIALSLGQIL